ncbi:acyltransferase [Pedobacter aquatilis]|uniref:acyltransferase family protein n=1 Tax=Pedobacter aquatilis TaxID=351343 RepID=UPI00292F846E|nr:acyltransferase [Pedobacter aquatilis]
MLAKQIISTLKPVFNLEINYLDSSKKIIPLDGLRGFAVLLVVFFHCFGFLRISYFGWMGVDLFFVLSGFLISGILIDGKSDKLYYKNFFGKRFLRIFPLYYFALLIITILSFVPFIKGIDKINAPNIFYWIYLQNWQTTYFGEFSKENKLLSHFWSLAIEEQFYIFWPFIIKRFSKNKIISFIIVFIIFAVLLRIYFFTHDNIGYYVNTFSRFDALCIGSLLAILIRDKKEILERFALYIMFISGLFIVFHAIFSGPHFSHLLMASFGFTLVSLFWASILIFAISGRVYLTKFFSYKFLTFFGKYSYGMYVYHAIIYILLSIPLTNFLNKFGNNTLIVDLITSLILVLLSVIVSFFSFNLFEKHFIKYKKYFQNNNEIIIQNK